MGTNDPIKNKRCLVVERVSTNLRFPQNKAYIVSYLCIAQDIPIYKYATHSYSYSSLTKLIQYIFLLFLHSIVTPFPWLS